MTAAAPPLTHFCAQAVAAAEASACLAPQLASPTNPVMVAANADTEASANSTNTFFMFPPSDNFECNVHSNGTMLSHRGSCQGRSGRVAGLRVPLVNTRGSEESRPGSPSAGGAACGMTAGGRRGQTALSTMEPFEVWTSFERDRVVSPLLKR